LRPKTTEQLRRKSEQVFLDYKLLDKIEKLMLHKSDSLLKTANVVQTAKPNVEQIRPVTK
jgi:hypothetical protein